MWCFYAVDFTTEHLGTGFSYSTDFSGITSLAWLRLHFEVTKLYTNNKTLSPLLHCLRGAVSVPLQGLASHWGWFYVAVLSGYLSSRCLAGFGGRQLGSFVAMATPGRAGAFPFAPAERARFLH